MFEQQLEKIGLSDKEARFYLASLRLGKSPVQKIAKESKVNRGTAYNIIQSLMEKGLMSSYEEGKKQYFFAESADKLSLLLERQVEQLKKDHEEFKKIIPALKKIDNKDKDKPVVRYFEGKNGIRAMVEDMYDVKKGAKIIMAYPFDKVAELFSSEDMAVWKEKRIKKDVYIKAMYTKKEGKYPGKTVKGVDAKVSMEKYPLESDIAVYENRIRIASLKKERPIGIIIENEDAANTLRSVFELAWEKAKEKEK